MFLTTSGAEGGVGIPLNRIQAPVMFHITNRSKAVLLILFSVFGCLCVSFWNVFTFCVSRLYLASTFWEKAAHSVYHMFSLYLDLLFFFIFCFCFFYCGLTSR